MRVIFKLHQTQKLKLNIGIGLVVLLVGCTAPTLTPTTTPNTVLPSATSTPQPTTLPTATTPLKFKQLSSMGSNIEVLALADNLLFTSDSPNRLTIFSLSNPTQPTYLSHLDIGLWPEVMEQSQGILYIVGSRVLQLVDVRNPGHPTLLGKLDLPEHGDNSFFPPQHHTRLKILGKRLWLSLPPLEDSDSPSLIEVDVANPVNPQQITQTSFPVKYGFDTSVDGASGVLVTHEKTSSQLYTFELDQPATLNKVEGLTLEDLYRTWKIGENVFVGTSRFHIAGGYFFSELPSLAIFQPDSHHHLKKSAVINTADLPTDVHQEGDLLYIIGYSKGSPGGNYWLKVVNIADPLNPESVGDFELAGYANQFQMQAGYLYVAASNGGLQIIDIHNPSEAKLVNTYGMTGAATWVEVHGDLAYVSLWRDLIGNNTPFNQVVPLVNVHSAVDPMLVGTYESSASIDVENGFAYIPGQFSGLQIVDVNDPDQSKLRSTYHPTEEIGAVRVLNQRAYLVTNYGLSALDVHSPDHPKLLSHLAFKSPVHNIAIDHGRVYVWGIQPSLYIIDVTNPDQPKQIGEYVFDSKNNVDGWTVEIHEYTAFIFNNFGGALDKGLQIVNLEDPANPIVIGNFNELGVTDLKFFGKKVFISGEGQNFVSGLWISDSTNPTLLLQKPQYQTSDSFGVGGYIEDLAVLDDKAILLSEGVKVLDISDNANPRLETTVEDYIDSGAHIAIQDNLAYITGGYNSPNLRIWQISR